MNVRCKVWLESEGEAVFGDGTAELLRGVDRMGSISAAARRMRMSYRQAWGAIRKIEQRLGEKMVETSVGGRSGGGAALTDTAREFLCKYERFREGLDRAMEETFRAMFGNSDPG